MAYLGPVTRWDLFWVDLNPTVGSEQAGERRPVVIVSADSFNQRFDTYTVCPLTKLEGKKRKPYPFEVQLTGDPIGNGLTSLVMPHQVRTISRYRLLERIGVLGDEQNRYDIETALVGHLGISLDD